MQKMFLAWTRASPAVIHQAPIPGLSPVSYVCASALGLCLKWFMGQCPISVIYNSLAVSLTLTLSSHPKECFDVPTLHGELWAWGRKQRS